MTRRDETGGGIAEVNRPYAAEPGGPARLGRWVLRLVGQVRRQCLSRLRPGYVRRARERRRGECRLCGSCCDLTFHCPYLDETRRCTHYEKRQLTCRDFPHDALDLRLTRVPCGHYFEEEAEAAVRIPLTRYGVREMIVFGGLAVAGVVASALVALYLVPLFVLALGFVLYFFRDPERRVPTAPKVLVSPADGRVVEIGEADGVGHLPGRAIKVAVFMSPLNVHVNRSPCRGRVEAVVHRPGRYRNAASPAASAENESNTLVIRNAEHGDTPVVVRQVAGVLARRIVCGAAEGDMLARGQRFGMIKFGSRAEVYVPVGSGFRVAVRLGQRVKAGETVLGAFE
jgi:phosphatidylserine decarboxylase